MNDNDFNVKISQFIGNEIKPNHNFEGRDDNRYFECLECGLTQSWSEYIKIKSHPNGLCPNTKDDYINDLNVIRYAENKVDYKYWIFLHKIVHEPDMPMNHNFDMNCLRLMGAASIKQRTEALIQWFERKDFEKSWYGKGIN